MTSLQKKSLVIDFVLLISLVILSLMLWWLVSDSTMSFGQGKKTIHAHYFYYMGMETPDQAITPGVWKKLPLSVIQNTKWGKQERHVDEKMKKEACHEYGIYQGCPGKAYELDHKYPRNSGGQDVLANLWPENKCQAHAKDMIEDLDLRLERKGLLTQKEAIERMDIWPAIYEQHYGKLPNCPDEKK